MNFRTIIGRTAALGLTLSLLGTYAVAAGPVVTTVWLNRTDNQPPVAEDSAFSTYKNIPGQVPLTISDPEDQPLTVTIVREPKRGQAAVGPDGAVTYTPDQNKVGRDSFTYRVADPSGGVSEEATVRIEIKKPSDRETYGDLEGDPALLAAVWLRESGVYQGEIVSGQLLFRPEALVTRGEFLAMCAGLMGRKGDAEIVSTGFADEAATAAWLSPFVTTALRCGYLSGVPTDGGLALLAEEPVTQAQAGKLVCGLLGLSQTGTAAVMAAESDVPVWAAGSASALSRQGVYTLVSPEAPMDRREAALLLYNAHLYAEAERENASLLSWAAK